MAKITTNIFAVFMLLSIASGCSPTRLGGMTVEQAFPEARVAKLVEAVSDGDYTEADRQIKLGANINTIGTDGISPLLWVMATRNLKGTEYMLKAGADPNYRDEKRKASAMALAAGGNRPDFLELLLKHKGNPNLIGPGDHTLLQIAARGLGDENENPSHTHGRENINLLLKYGADINGHTVWGTAAHSALTYGRYDIVAFYLEKGLNYNLQGLAKSVEARIVGSPEQNRWKEKVIQMLKERGVKFPAFDPENPQGK